MSVVLDVQGFKIENNKFLAKEFCAYDGVRLCHYIFKAPFPWDLLPPPLKIQAKWLTDNYHGYCWNAMTCQVTDTEFCHKECLGCTQNFSPNHCHACKNFDDHGLCVNSCPDDNLTQILIKHKSFQPEA
ncbi:unnamed protein product [Acanthoscelides obtectus]|uniref:Furin-like cysteine-rich domain-containing protein n=1 Tax=Acanthoscelides obtectus TaxID=200917 RepID=A0A9P0K8L7_ACAOB|nr:unnamed protein product [Acanthoscelides obtectus]CAK1673489.1 hypothetical protein AOBTE_LOCUS29357 [Acanthoscelides obtectus]